MEKYFELKFLMGILGYIALALIILAVGLCALYFKITEFLKERFRKKGEK